MLNVGIIGNGSIASAHRSAYQRLQEIGLAQVVTFCDIRPERLTAPHTDVYNDIMEKSGALPG